MSVLKQNVWLGESFPHIALPKFLWVPSPCCPRNWAEPAANTKVWECVVQQAAMMSNQRSANQRKIPFKRFWRLVDLLLPTKYWEWSAGMEWGKELTSLIQSNGEKSLPNWSGVGQLALGPPDVISVRCQTLRDHCGSCQWLRHYPAPTRSEQTALHIFMAMMISAWSQVSIETRVLQKVQEKRELKDDAHFCKGFEVASYIS